MPYIKNNNIYLLIISLIILFGSCSNNNEPILPATTPEFITYGNWEISDYLLEESVALNGTEVDLHITTFDKIQSCEQDNIFLFNESGIFNLKGNTSKCSSFEEETIKSGDWTLNIEQDNINIIGKDILKRGDDGHTDHTHDDPFEGNEFNFEILQIDIETLKLKIFKTEEETTNSGFIITNSATLTLTFTNTH